MDNASTTAKSKMFAVEENLMLTVKELKDTLESYSDDDIICFYNGDFNLTPHFTKDGSKYILIKTERSLPVPFHDFTGDIKGLRSIEPQLFKEILLNAVYQYYYLESMPQQEEYLRLQSSAIDILTSYEFMSTGMRYVLEELQATPKFKQFYDALIDILWVPCNDVMCYNTTWIGIVSKLIREIACKCYDSNHNVKLKGTAINVIAHDICESFILSYDTSYPDYQKCSVLKELLGEL